MALGAATLVAFNVLIGLPEVILIGSLPYLVFMTACYALLRTTFALATLHWYWQRMARSPNVVLEEFP